jgi:hypothetical protein
LNKFELQRLAEENGWDKNLPKTLRDYYSRSAAECEYIDAVHPEVLEKIASDNPGKTGFAASPRDIFESRGYTFPASREEFYAGDSEYQALCQTVFPEELEKLLNPPQRAKREHQVAAGETEIEAARKHAKVSAKKFVHDFPQYVVCKQNSDAIGARRAALNVGDDNYDYALLVEIYRDLVQEGALQIDLTKIGLPQATLDFVQNKLLSCKLPSLILSGAQLIRVLRGVPDAERMLDPDPISQITPTPLDIKEAKEQGVDIEDFFREKLRIKRLSADEFIKQDPALKWAREQEERAARVANYEQEVAAFVRTQPDFIASEEHRDLILDFLKERGLPMSSGSIRIAFDALVEAGKMDTDRTRRVSYGGSTLQVGEADPNRNRPPESALSDSLKRRIRSMSSDEYQAFLIANPAIAKKIDAAGTV